MRNKIYRLLRWSEKYTGTDMIYLAKGGSWLTFGQVISSLSSFLLAIAFANLLPKETYGVYKYVLSIISILTISTLGGIDTAITQAAARGYEGSFFPAFKTKIKFGLLGSLASLSISGYYYLNHNIEITISFLIVAAFLPFFDPLALYDAFLRGKKKFDVSSKYNVISQIIAAAFTVGIILLTKNLILILFSYFTIWTILRFIFLKLVLRQQVLNQQSDPDTIRYGKHISLINVFTVVAIYLDKVLVFHFLGSAQLALYAIAIAPPEQIKGLIKIFSTLALPKLSEKSIEEARKTIPRKTIMLAVGIAAMTIVYIVIAPFIYKIFFPKYIEAVVYSQIFAISMIALASQLPNAALISQKQQKKLYQYNTISSVVVIIGLIVGGYWFGLWGIVFVRIFNRLFNLLYSLHLIRKV